VKEYMTDDSGTEKVMIEWEQPEEDSAAASAAQASL
jgi:hypothetical protein